MKITGVEPLHISVPYDYGGPLQKADAIPWRNMETLFVKVTTDEGVTGLGDAAGPLGVIREYVKLLTPIFTGRSLYDFDMVASEIRNRMYHFGSQGHFIAALGGINIAVFDAMGKTLNLPVHDLLGGVELSVSGFALDKPGKSFVACNKVWNSTSESLRSKYAATSRNQGSGDFSVGVVNLGGSHALLVAPATRTQSDSGASAECRSCAKC